MKYLFLKFASREEALSVFSQIGMVSDGEIVSSASAEVDVVFGNGVIFQEDGTPRTGFHVNVAMPDDTEIPILDPYSRTPTSPACVFAGYEA